MKRVAIFVILAALTVGFSSCSAVRHCQAPEVEMPGQIASGYTDSLTIADLSWWQFYGDSTLRRVIELTLENNKDMLAAAARVEQMRQFQKTEESENCRAEIEDNIEKIGLGIASESIRHRFFLVFQYEAKMRAKRNTVKGIIQRLNEEADTARRYLDICELEVLEPRYTDDFVLKLLYELINKATSLRVKLPEGVFDMTTEVHGVYEE